MIRPECVWLTRHAETSAPHLFHGAESDVGLSDLGQRQALAAAEWFSHRQPTVVISSAMRRAVDTARPIAARCACEHRVLSEWHERRIGSLSGTSFSVTEGAWPETVRRWAAGDIDYTTPGAESFRDLQTRLLAAWQQLQRECAGERVVIVAHGVVCKVLLLSLLPGMGPQNWIALGRVANLAVSELRPTSEGTWHATQLLVLPEPVALLNTGVPPGIAERPRSEA
jgi:probable phosphoglycerate mutase